MLKTDPPKWYWTEMILQIKHGLLRNTNYMHLVTYWQHLRVQPVDNHCILWIIQEYFAFLFSANFSYPQNTAENTHYTVVVLRTRFTVTNIRKSIYMYCTAYGQLMLHMNIKPS